MFKVKSVLSAIFACVLTVATIGFAACSKQPPEQTGSNDEPETITVVTDVLKPVEFEELAQNRYVVSARNNVLPEENANYTCTVIPVTAGERYVMSFAIQSAKSCGVIYADANMACVQQLFTGDNNYVEYNDIQITVPEGVSNLAINTRAPKKFTINKLVKEQAEISAESLPTTLNVACANLGKFDYANGVTSDEEYKQNWQKMLSENAYDVFMYEDAIDAFSDGSSANAMLSANGEEYINLAGLANPIRASLSAKPQTVTVIPFAQQIEGSSKVAVRFYAIRLTYHIGGKHVAVYGMHLVAESHISSTIQEDGTSLSQKLRQMQFAGLLADAENYDEAILMGDFNAQKAAEYEIFTKAGYDMLNCGKFGTFATLRDIPADNIIVSEGITINSFKLLNYNLNTDHTPIYACLSVN